MAFGAWREPTPHRLFQSQRAGLFIKISELQPKGTRTHKSRKSYSKAEGKVERKHGAAPMPGFRIAIRSVADHLPVIAAGEHPTHPVGSASHGFFCSITHGCAGIRRLYG